MLLKGNTKVRLILIHLIILLTTISCDKKYDLIEQTQFLEPTPKNNAENVNLKNVSVGFQSITDKTIVRKYYLDTINPPLNELNSSRPIVAALIPDKSYFWYIIVENISGYNQSDVQTFKTMSFNGVWKLDSLYYSDSNPFIQLDDTGLANHLVTDYDLLEIKIDGDNSQIKLFGNETNYLNTNFSYDISLDSLHFINPINDDKYSFSLINAGERNNNILLFLKNSKHRTLYYSKQ